MRAPLDVVRVTQPFGPKHNGVDLGCATGTPVHAPERMVVRFAGDGELIHLPDNGVCILGQAVADHYVQGRVPTSNRSHALLHLDDVCVHHDQVVEAGELVGWSDSTGDSRAPHLHWSARRDGSYVDPLAEPDYLPRNPTTRA